MKIGVEQEKESRERGTALYQKITGKRGQSGGGVAAGAQRYQGKEEAREAANALYGKLTQSAVKVDADYLNKYAQDVGDMLNTSGAALGGMTWGNKKEVYAEHAQKYLDLAQRGRNVRSFLERNKEAFDPEVYSSFLNQMDESEAAMERNLEVFGQQRKYFDQWETEEAYNSYVNQSQWLKKYQEMKAGELYDAMEGMEEGEEKAFLREYSMGFDGMKSSAAEEADKAERALEAYIHSDEYLNARGNGRTYQEKSRNREEANRKREALERKAKYLRALDGEYRMGSLMENIEAEAEKAEKEYNDYINSEEYSAAMLAKRQEAQWDVMAVQFGVPPSGEAGMKAAAMEKQANQMRDKAAYYRSLANQKADRDIQAEDLKALDKWSEDERRELEYYIAQRNAENFAPMGYGMSNAVSERILAPLAKKYGRERVLEIAESYWRSETEKTAQQVAESAQGNVNGGFWNGVGQSAISVGANLIGSASGILGYANEAASMTGRYSTLDPNNIGMLPGTYGTNVQAKVAQNIEDGAFGKGGAVLYRAGMSAAENLARIAAGGEFGSLALAATGSFAQTVQELSANGVDPARAAMMGVTSGALEVITEKISLDNLLEQMGKTINNPKNFREILAAAVQAGFVEVSEEELSFLGGIMAEAVILRGDASWNRRVQEMQAYGLSPAQAREQATMDKILEAADTAIESFLSGGMMSAGTNVTANVRAKLGDTTQNRQKKWESKQQTQQTQTEQQASKEQAREESLVADAKEIFESGAFDTEVDMNDPEKAIQKARQAYNQGRIEEGELEVCEAWASRAAAGQEVTMEESEAEAQNTASEAQEAAQEPEQAEGEPVFAQQEQPVQEAQAAQEAEAFQKEQPVQEAPALEETITQPVQQEAAMAAQKEDAYGQAEQTAGRSLPDGGQERNADQSAQGKNGILAGSPEGKGRRNPRVQAVEAAGDLQRAARDIQQISTRELGIENGTETKKLKAVPRERLQEDTRKYLEAIEEKTGREVVVVLGSLEVRGENGQKRQVKGVFTGDRIIVRGDNLKVSAEQIADHEAYHSLAADDPGLNRRVRRAIREQYSEKALEKVMEQYVDKIKGLYDLSGMSEGEAVETLWELVREEIYADAYAGLNAFGAQADQFRETVRQEADQSTEAGSRRQDNGVRQTRGPDGQRYSDETEAEKKKKPQNISEAIVQQWEEAYAKRYSVVEDSEKELTSEALRQEAQADITARFENTVDQVLNGTYQGNDNALLGYTPDIFAELGVPSLPVVMGAGHIYSTAKTEAEAKQDGKYNSRTHYHGLGDATVKSIYEKLSDPEMIIASKDVSNSFPVRSMRSVVAIVDVGTNNKSLLLPVEITAERQANGMAMDVNVLSSVYEKNVESLIREAVAQENSGEIGIFYIKKAAAGAVAFKGLIPKAAYRASAYGPIIHKISEKVNLKIQNQTQTKQFMDWFGDWQNQPSRASKVVNADGTPKVMYRGDAESIAVFDRAKSKYSNLYGRGFYFTDSQSHAGQYGKASAYYLDVKNPVRTDKRSITKNQMRKFLEAVAEHEDYGLENYGYGATAESVLRKVYGKSDFAMLNDVSATAIGDTVAAVELFNEVNGTNYDGFILPTETVVFKSTQIKSATDNVGTFDRKNPDIRYSMEEDTEDQEMPKDISEAIVQQWEEDYAKRYSAEDSTQEQDEAAAIHAIGRKSVNEFTPEDIGKTRRMAERYFQEIGTKSPFFRAWFGDWRAYDQSTVQLATEEGSARGVQKNLDTGWKIQVSGKVFNETKAHAAPRNRSAKPYIPYINDIVRKAVLLDSSAMDISKVKSANSLLMHSMYAVADNGSGPKLLKLYVEEMNDPNSRDTTKRAYQLQNIEVSSLTGEKNTISSGNALASFKTADIKSVADLFDAVKRQDSNFKPWPVDPVVLNEDGTPKVFYHGTDAAWTEYDLQKNVNQAWGEGIYLTPDPQRARMYGENVMAFYVQAATNNREARRTGRERDHLAMKNGDILVYDPSQIKSATDNIGTFDRKNPDIRYSMEEETDAAAIEKELRQAQKQELEERMKERLGEEKYQEYQRQKKEETKQKRSREARERRAQEAQRNVKPSESIRRMSGKLCDMFSVGPGMRRAARTEIETRAKQWLQEGRVTQSDYDDLFYALYESGVVTIPADEYLALGREAIVGGKIYISDSVKADFGSDWSAFRKRAWEAGVEITNDQNEMGLGEWNFELAQLFPGLFHADDTDGRMMLEQIVQLAEDGKAEEMSLAEYTAMLAGENHTTEREYLDMMERRMDGILQSFFESAGVETKLRKRTERQKAQEQERRIEAMDDYREQRRLRELKKKILKNLQWMQSNKKRAPADLKQVMEETIGDLDVYSAREPSKRYRDAHDAVADLVDKLKKKDPTYVPSAAALREWERCKETKLDGDINELQVFYEATAAIRTDYENRKRTMIDGQKTSVRAWFRDIKAEFEDIQGGDLTGTMKKLFSTEQLTAMNVGRMLSGWNPNSSFVKIFKLFEDGERQTRRYEYDAKRIFTDFLKENSKWAAKADGNGKDAVWYSYNLPASMVLGNGNADLRDLAGEQVKVWMTPAQKIYLYLESMNYNNRKHMEGGRVFVDKKLWSEGKYQEAYAKGTKVRLNETMIQEMVKDLTPEEKAFADLAYRYFNSFSKERINSVSNQLVGCDIASVVNYAPIYTDKNYVHRDITEAQDIAAANAANLKERQFAGNPSYNMSVFDALEKHIGSMSRYYGVAIPTRDVNMLLNCSDGEITMREMITQKWGGEAVTYIENMIRDMQGEKAGEEKTTVDKTLDKLKSNYISGTFAFNPSIVLKQLGSVPMAATYLGAENMVGGKETAHLDKKLIEVYTPDLGYRSMGYATPELKQFTDNGGLVEQSKGMNFLFGGGAITWMDAGAASVLWPWAENKVAKEHPELELGTDAQIRAGQSPFYQKVAEEFNNAVSHSQSVSDYMHQSSMRRSKNLLVNMLTLFKSDSAQTYNAMRQTLGEAGYYKTQMEKLKKKLAEGSIRQEVYDEQMQEMKAGYKKSKGAFATATVATLLGSAWAEGIALLMNLWKWRGKDYEDEEGNLTWDSAKTAFLENLMTSMCGVVVGGEELAEFIGNLLDGEKNPMAVGTMATELLNDMVNAFTNAGGKIQGVVKGAIEIAVNQKEGEDLVGDYIRTHAGELVGGLRDIAATFCTYFKGIPVQNVTNYLMGAMRNLVPELGANYDSAMGKDSKYYLQGESGKYLDAKIGNLIEKKGISESEDTAAAIARLYEAGFEKALPGEAPKSVAIGEEERTLNAYQKQTYETVFAETVAESLDELVQTADFQEASEEEKETMLKWLYDYGADKAKSTVFGAEWEPKGLALKLTAAKTAGLGIVDALRVKMAQERINERYKDSDLKNDVISAKKAVEFSQWMDAQKWSEAEEAAITDVFEYQKNATEKIGEYTQAGLSMENAYELIDTIKSLSPEEGETQVSWEQSLQAVADMNLPDDEWVAAMVSVTPKGWSAREKIPISYEYGVSPETYTKWRLLLPEFDADGNGNYTRREVEDALDSWGGAGDVLLEITGNAKPLSNQEKAVLWQLQNKQWKPKSNPYDKEIGEEIYNLLNEEKSE